MTSWPMHTTMTLTVTEPDGTAHDPITSEGDPINLAIGLCGAGWETVEMSKGRFLLRHGEQGLMLIEFEVPDR